MIESLGLFVYILIITDLSAYSNERYERLLLGAWACISKLWKTCFVVVAPTRWWQCCMPWHAESSVNPGIYDTKFWRHKIGYEWLKWLPYGCHISALVVTQYMGRSFKPKKEISARHHDHLRYQQQLANLKHHCVRLQRHGTILVASQHLRTCTINHNIMLNLYNFCNWENCINY